jgi:tRNA(Ile2) C34 agmatinyltransferase TiaS
MNPLCPNCLNEMTKAASSRNLFNCEPCREIIQFFDFRADRDRAERLKPSQSAAPRIGNVRAA